MEPGAVMVPGKRKLAQLPVIVHDMKTMKDKSWRLTFETRELGGDEVAFLADSLHGEGWLVFSPNNIDQVDIPDAEAEPGTKTPAQRLRGKIYIMWKTKGGTGDFESYYRASIERLIEHIDKQLT